MVRLQALCCMTGSFDLGEAGRVDRIQAGGVFWVDEENAARLIRRGCAAPAPEPLKGRKRKKASEG
jgi:hypothetical protein